MQDYQKYFIEILKHYINNEEITLRPDADYKQLFEFARLHNLGGVLFCAVSNAEDSAAIPAEVYSAAQESFFDLVYSANLQMQVYSLLKAALTAAQLRFVPFKGAVLRDCYPVPESRAMGDIDILIDIENRGSVRRVLKEAGFACINSNGPVWDYEKNGVKIEVHTSILHGRIGNTDAAEYFDTAIEKAEFAEGEFIGALPRDYHFALLIAHAAHHFWFHGAGIRFILDFAIAIKNMGASPEAALEILEAAGLSDFARNMLSVCKKWFDIGIDFGCDTAETEDYLCGYGAFGTDGKSTGAVVARKALEEGKSSSAAGRRLALLFPSYEKMKGIPYIKFIEGRPYLTPLAWGYRFGYNLKNRRALMLKTAKDIGTDEAIEVAKSELEFFKKIGLD